MHWKNFLSALTGVSLKPKEADTSVWLLWNNVFIISLFVMPHQNCYFITFDILSFWHFSFSLHRCTMKVIVIFFQWLICKGHHWDYWPWKLDIRRVGWRCPPCRVSATIYFTASSCPLSLDVIICLVMPHRLPRQNKMKAQGYTVISL